MIMVRLERVWIILRFLQSSVQQVIHVGGFCFCIGITGNGNDFAYIGGKTIFIKTCYLVQVNQIGAVGLEKASAYKEFFFIVCQAARSSVEGSVCHFKGDQMILDFYKNNVRDEKPDNTGAGF